MANVIENRLYSKYVERSASAIQFCCWLSRKLNKRCIDTQSKRLENPSNVTPLVPRSTRFVYLSLCSNEFSAAAIWVTNKFESNAMNKYCKGDCSGSHHRKQFIEHRGCTLCELEFTCCNDCQHGIKHCWFQ